MGRAYIVLLLIGLCLPTPAFSQHQTDNWFFGGRAGLQFKKEGVVPLSGSQMYQYEGVATMSDRRTGELLFYSDGISVWNREHQVMPSGRGLMGSKTSTQSALIVPFPGNRQQYYLFTTKAFNDSTGGLYYSVLDMTLSNGLGDLMAGQKNILLERLSTEKLTAIPHADNKSFWILSHKWDSDVFLVYLLTSKGLVIRRETAIGTKYEAGDLGGSASMGYLKASLDSKRLAAAVLGDSRPFELYDFDNLTGVISNYRSLGNFSSQYGVSFSPDNTKLYLTGISNETESYQFDLTDSSPPVELRILNSLDERGNRYFVSGSLQLGIDGRLYSSDFEKLAIIEYPNRKGEACRANYADFDLGSGRPFLGLPNFVEAFFDSTYNARPDISANSACNQVLSIYPNPVSTNILTIELDSLSCTPIGFSVFDIQGRLVVTYPNPLGPASTLDVSTWTAGLYIIVVDYGEDRVVKKIVKL